METRNRQLGRALLRITLVVGIVILLCYFLTSCGSEQRPPGPDHPPTVSTLITQDPTMPTIPTFHTFHTAAPPDVPPHSPSKVDDILKGLDWGQIAFNHPKAMELDDTIQIELLLSLTKTIEDLKRDIGAAGDKEGYPVRVSNRMEARLTGPGFQITATTPEQQAVSSLETAVWKWDVKAIKPGLQALHLTLSAILSINGHDAPSVIKTFDRQLEIRVSVADLVISFLKANWQWLWAAILVPVAGAAWTWWRRRKKAKKKKRS